MVYYNPHITGKQKSPKQTLKQPGQLKSWPLKKWAFKALAELLLLGPTDENHHSTRVHHPWYPGPVQGGDEKREKRGCRLGGGKNKMVIVYL